MYKNGKFILICFIVSAIAFAVFQPLGAILLIITSILFLIKVISGIINGIKNGTAIIIDNIVNFSDYYGRDTMFFYQSYDKEINTELNTFKYNLEGLAKKYNYRYKHITYKGEDYAICANNSGIYIINFDNTAEKICGIADDESFSTLDDRYVDRGSAYKKNKVLEFKKVFVERINLPKQLADRITCWTVHSSYCSYNIVPSFYGNFRHLNTLNFESYFKERADSQFKLISDNNIDILYKNLDIVKSYN